MMSTVELYLPCFKNLESEVEGKIQTKAVPCILWETAVVSH